MNNLSLDSCSTFSPSIDLAKELYFSDEKAVVLCLGEGGQAGIFAKVVAELLVKKYKIQGFVYGKKMNMLTLKNLQQAISFVKQVHKFSKIIVVFSKYEKFNDKNILYYGKGKSVYDDVVLGDYSICAVLKDVNQINGIKQYQLNRMAELVSKIINDGIIFSNKLKGSNTNINFGIV